MRWSSAYEILNLLTGPSYKQIQTTWEMEVCTGFVEFGTHLVHEMGSNLHILVYLPQNFLTVVQGEGRKKVEGGGGKTHFLTFRTQTFQITDIIKFTITCNQRSYYSSAKKKADISWLLS